MGWITAHSLLLVEILGSIVAVDHALASTDLVKANSTLQAIVNGIGTVGSWLLSLVSPKP